MKNTANYQLNQWEQADRILMADFNADNLKVDGALAGLQTTVTAQTAELAKRGNCSIGLLSYTGAGTAGVNNPTRITFPRRPKAFIVRGGRTMAVWTELDTNRLFVIAYNGNSAVFPDTLINWSGNQAQIYNTGSMNATIFQANEASVVYHVIAFYAEA